MKTKKTFSTILALVLALVMSLFILSCSKPMDGRDDGNSPYDNYQSNSASDTGDEFTSFTENPFVDAAKTPKSYFSMDVSTASYSVLRNYINKNLTISKNMVKLEEMVNYFRYSYPAPTGETPLSISGGMIQCPWNSQNMLCTVGVRALDIEFSAVRNNLVFLIDTSGSMDSFDKLDLLKEAFCILADNINDHDTVSIVTYAGSSSVLLSGEKGVNRGRIKNIVTDLAAGGTTAGAGGIERAYQLAEQYYIDGGNNRVILATDGDFNVGISSQDQLKQFISQKRSQSKGVYLSIMGFGLGNLKNTTMDTLAQNGNGAAYYIDNLLEAKKVMATEMRGTLVTVADDVKAEVEFNPDRVEKYRLLGYETKLLTQEEWENNDADAGEIGAGHTVTAVYEVTLKEDLEQCMIGTPVMTARIRYKQPYGGERPTSDTRPVLEISRGINESDIPTYEQIEKYEDLVFISCVVEFGLILRNSDYKGDANLNAIIQRLDELTSTKTDEYRADFVTLVKKYAKAD